MSVYTVPLSFWEDGQEPDGSGNGSLIVAQNRRQSTAPAEVPIRPTTHFDCNLHYTPLVAS